MITLKAKAIAEAMSASLSGAVEGSFSAVFTDTRRPTPGGLFFALTGPNFDGHDYIDAAVEAGAKGVVVSRPVEGDRTSELSISRFLVADTRQALTDLAGHVRSVHPGRFIAVTGSVGKTTMKDMLGAALKGSGAVAVSPGNWNNDIGVPLALFATTGQERFVVLELGMSAPGEIRDLSALARPHCAMVTRAAAAHLEFFNSVDEIADAKAEIWERTETEAWSITCADDDRLMHRLQAIPSGRKLTYGTSDTADFRLKELRQSADGLEVVVDTPTGRVGFSLNALGRHNGINAAGAIAGASALGAQIDEAAESLSAHYRPAPHRLNLKRTREGMVILDDCYNANPASTNAALCTLADIAPAKGGIKGAVLGSMLELGPSAQALHRAVGRFAGEQGVQWLGATGPHAEAIAEGARDAGIDEVLTADDAMGLLAPLATLNGAGNWLLLKGSRGGRLERLLEPLGVEEAA